MDWTGPEPTILIWASVVRPSKQWRYSPLFTCRTVEVVKMKKKKNFEEEEEEEGSRERG